MLARRMVACFLFICLAEVSISDALTLLSWHHRDSQGRERDTSSSLFMASSEHSESNLLSRRNLLLLSAGTLGLAVTAGEVYARVASLQISDDSITLNPTISDWSNVKELTVVFHGAGGPDVYTEQLMGKLSKGNKNSAVAMVEWQDYSSNLLQASANGRVVGKRIAQYVLDNASPTMLQRLHVIGISVGAFCADELVKSVKSKSPSTVIQETLLDPFQQSGIVDVGFGKRNFGKYADYAQQYLNTDDPVPFTNTPLPHCVTYNITSLRPPELFGHDWPVEYYSTASGETGFVPTSLQMERGTLIQVTS